MPVSSFGLPRQDITSDDLRTSEWKSDVDKAFSQWLGNRTRPGAPSQLKVTGQPAGEGVQWKADPELGITEYEVFRGATKDPANATLIGTVSQPSDVSFAVSFFDPVGTDADYYWVRSVKGMWRPKVAGSRAGPANANDVSGFLVEPPKVTDASTNVGAIADTQGNRSVYATFAFTKPNPIGTYEYCEIWVVGYRGTAKPVLLASSAEGPFTTSMLVSNEKVAFLFVSANLYSRRKRELVNGTYVGTDGNTTTLDDPGASFIQDGITTDDLLVNTTNKSLFSITAVNSETQLAISYIVGTPTTAGEGDFDNGDTYTINQGPFDTDVLDSPLNDDSVVDPLDMVLDVDLLEVTGEGADVINEVLVGFGATADIDSAIQCTVQWQITGSSSFGASGGFSAPAQTKTGAYPLLFQTALSANPASWEFTGNITNSFGPSDYISPVTYTPSLDPGAAENDVGALAEFGVWTVENPPTPPDSQIVGMMHALDFKLEPTNNYTTWDIEVFGHSENPFPTETVQQDETTTGNPAATTFGNKDVTITGYSASANEFDNKIFRFGRDSGKNQGQILEEWAIASHTTGDPFTITLSGPGGTRNNGNVTNWSIIDAPLRTLVDVFMTFGPGEIDTTGNSKNPELTIPRKYRNVELTGYTDSGLYWMARTHNYFGRGALQYATNATAGSATEGDGVRKVAHGYTPSQGGKSATGVLLNFGIAVGSGTGPNINGSPPPQYVMGSTTDQYRKVNWNSGDAEWPNKDTETVPSGSFTGAPDTLYWIYVLHTPSVSLQFTTTFTDAMGDDRTVAGQMVTHNATDNEPAALFFYGALSGPIFTAAMASIGKLAALTVDAGRLTAGELHGATAAFVGQFGNATWDAGARVQIDGADGFRTIDSVGNTRVMMDTDGELIRLAPASTSQDSGTITWRNLAGGGKPTGSEEGNIWVSSIGKTFFENATGDYFFAEGIGSSAGISLEADFGATIARIIPGVNLLNRDLRLEARGNAEIALWANGSKRFGSTITANTSYQDLDMNDQNLLGVNTITGTDHIFMNTGTGADSVMIGDTAAPAARLEVAQRGASAGFPAFRMEQLDLNQPMMTVHSTSAVGDVTKPIVDEADSSPTPTLVGYFRLAISDTANLAAEGNAMYIPYYTLA